MAEWQRDDTRGLLLRYSRDFRGGPVIQTPCSKCRGPGLILVRELDLECGNSNLAQPNKYIVKKRYDNGITV